MVPVVLVVDGAGGFGGFEDIFSFFGGGGASRNPTLSSRDDLRYRVELDLKKPSLNGKKVKYNREALSYMVNRC